MQFVITKEAKVLGVIVVVLLLGVHTLGGPFWYYAPATTAQVIDEDTGKPLEGAVVLVEWQQWDLGYSNGAHVHVGEALTGPSGSFAVRRWGPKLRRPGSWLLERYPYIYVYKPGYQTQRVDNCDLDSNCRGYGGRMQKRSNVASLWNEKVIPLPRARSQKEGERSREHFESYFVYATGGAWAKDSEKRFPVSARIIKEEAAWFPHPDALVPIKPVKDPLEGVIFGVNSVPSTATASDSDHR